MFLPQSPFSSIGLIVPPPACTSRQVSQLKFAVNASRNHPKSRGFCDMRSLAGRLEDRCPIRCAGSTLACNIAPQRERAAAFGS